MGYVSDNLNLLSDIAKCIAMQFGENCEVVLHDLTLPYDQTIVAIWNGHVTGRKVGDGGTNAGLEILKGSASPDDQYSYINATPSGRVLRSSSKYFRDEYGKVNGSMCINLDITDMIKCENTLRSFTSSGSSSLTQTPELFVGNVDELLEIMMKEAVNMTGKSVGNLTKEEKVAIVHSLDGKGFFLIKKAAEKLADFLGLSRYSIYNYLNESH
ncbi:MAG: helix-turn-helix transcriptional regulator [Hungatella sp.]|jgi:predicted transcriptional regulator YheO|uniref:PAS domain-containing protein n=1 Tax=Clostridium sp. NkU-1 TaxID=1095009 RepID=UPI0006D20FFA|nr:helix-turn-helix transcriptional regulator [Hungatella sp.]MDR1772797.1 helix-turn-helix transcriptional regulator [Hungatella sp.]MDR2025074.1 helix-turn-helix transcriptional regulator [Hungatella sp.]